MLIFEDSPDVVDFIVQNIEIMQFMPDEYIIRQGQRATHMYFLSQGLCEVLVKDIGKKKNRFVKDLYSGSLFGEIAFL